MSIFKSEVAPKGLQFNMSDFVVSGKYSTIITIVSYPKYIYPGYLSSLTSMSGIKIVAKHIPIPFSSISRMINKQVADLKIRYTEEKDLSIYVVAIEAILLILGLIQRLFGSSLFLSVIISDFISL